MLDRIRAAAYVFPGSNGDVRSPNEITRRWSFRVTAARDALGSDALPWLTIRGLRHTHATILMEAGEHPGAVQERLGHADINMTFSVYSHVTATMQCGVVDTISRLFG